jgi:hypothetical protein
MFDKEGKEAIRWSFLIVYVYGFLSFGMELIFIDFSCLIVYVLSRVGVCFCDWIY